MSILISLALLQATAAAPPATTEVAAVPPDDAKIICRTVVPTGSRIGGERVCLPKREWRRLHESGQQATREMQDSFSKRPGQQ